MDNSLPLALSYDDVLLVPQYSEIESRSEVDVATWIAPGLELKIPLISTKMDTVTGVEMAIKMGRLGGMGILPRFDKAEDQAEMVREVAVKKITAAAAVGVKDGFMERARMLVKAGAKVLNVDVAHGHMKKTIETVAALKNEFGKKMIIIAGIAATGECARDLYKAGADSLLVGVGAGSICTTRVMTGCGLPGLASLWAVAPVARKFKKTFMPDAGIRTSGDIVKALAAGASAIVAGSIFAGSDESPGKLITIEGRKYKKYNGSTSPAEKKRQIERDGTDKSAFYLRHLEGVEAMVPYKGPVEDIVLHLLAGVRSGMAYCGAMTIPELWQKAEFARITGSGYRENGAHDVIPKLESELVFGYIIMNMSHKEIDIQAWLLKIANNDEDKDGLYPGTVAEVIELGIASLTNEIYHQERGGAWHGGVFDGYKLEFGTKGGLSLVDQLVGRLHWYESIRGRWSANEEDVAELRRVVRYFIENAVRWELNLMSELEKEREKEGVLEEYEKECSQLSEYLLWVETFALSLEAKGIEIDETLFGLIKGEYVRRRRHLSANSIGSLVQRLDDQRFNLDQCIAIANELGLDGVEECRRITQTAVEKREEKKRVLQ